jgi:hypothetical protein
VQRLRAAGERHGDLRRNHVRLRVRRGDSPVRGRLRQQHVDPDLRVVLCSLHASDGRHGDL